MRFAYLKYRLKKLGCYLLIIILLPYIITVFLSGWELMELPEWTRLW